MISKALPPSMRICKKSILCSILQKYPEIVMLKINWEMRDFLKRQCKLFFRKPEFITNK